MKYTKRFLQRHRYLMRLGTFAERPRPEWLTEYDKGVNDGKVWRYDYVFWTATVAGLCLGIVCTVVGHLIYLTPTL